MDPVEGAATALTMPLLLESVGTILKALLEWAVETGETVISHPLLLLGVVVPIACTGIGVFKRLLRF